MARAYFRAIRGLPLARQYELADAAKIAKGARYEDGKSGFRQRDAAIMSCRPGDADGLWVADLTVLANNRDDLTEVLKDLATRKIDVIEGRTGRTSAAPHDGAMMFRDAVRYWSRHGKTFGKETASQAGKRGAEVARLRHNEGRMPRSAAGAIWHGKRWAHLSNDDVVDVINADERYETKYSIATLYRHHGPRRRPPAPVE